MITSAPRRANLLGDLLVVVVMGAAIAALCIALAWMVPFELVPPRPQ
jgi:hypothetical protein